MEFDSYPYQQYTLEHPEVPIAAVIAYLVFVFGVPSDGNIAYLVLVKLVFLCFQIKNQNAATALAPARPSRGRAFRICDF